MSLTVQFDFSKAADGKAGKFFTRAIAAVKSVVGPDVDVVDNTYTRTVTAKGIAGKNLLTLARDVARAFRPVTDENGNVYASEGNYNIRPGADWTLDGILFGTGAVTQKTGTARVDFTS